MHTRLISYLKDNRDQIIETWLLEAEVPTIDDQLDQRTGVPVDFLAGAFDRTLTVIETGEAPNTPGKELHLDDILGVSCTCKQRTMGGRVCIELHDSGLTAFLSVFDGNWDASEEFTKFDREHFTDLINHALSGVLGYEIEHCQYKQFRSDCPFAAGPPKSNTSDV